jgi:hypothetical protein
MRAVGLPPRQPSRRAGVHAAIRCAVPRTDHRVSAAQRDSTRSLGRASRGHASTNHPARGVESLVEPTRSARWTEASGTPARRLSLAGSAVRALTACGRILLSWLAGRPRRLGDQLFAMNDTEARWRGWQITRTRGNFGRGYRDPHFGLLAECPGCRGAGGTADRPCPPCLGTGRITREAA